MKVAQVTGHLMPEIGYQEVYLARAFSRLGHQVRVFTSTAVSPSGRGLLKGEYPPGLTRDPDYGYEILRFPALLSVRTKVLAGGLMKALKAFDPEIVVGNGIAKFFGWELVLGGHELDAPLVLLFGDAAEYVRRDTSWTRFTAVGHDVLHTLTKSPLYRRAVRRADRIVLNLPETETYFRRFLSRDDEATFDRKMKHLALGFDPDEFHFSASLRSDGRKELGVRETDPVLVTTTRVTPGKKLERVVDSVTSLHRDGLDVWYCLIGFLDDRYGEDLRDYIRSQPRPDRFHLYPFLTHEHVRRFYCAADAGIWIKAAISIQEAMGTGLPVVIPRKASVRHLVEDGRNGWYFGVERELIDALRIALDLDGSRSEHVRNREELAEKNAEFLSYDYIASEIIAGLET